MRVRGTEREVEQLRNVKEKAPSVFADDRPGFLLFVKNKNLSSHLLSFVLIVFWSETSLSECKQLFF